MLSEVSQAERKTNINNIAYVRKLKNDADEFICKTENKPKGKGKRRDKLGV